MIITLKGADFSASNIGTLSSWRITRSLGSGATYEGPTSVDKGAAFTATVTLAEGYEIGTAGVTVTMGGTVLSGAHFISGNVITITIASVTGNVLIKVPTVNTSGGDEPEEPVTPTNYTFTINPDPTSATVTLSATGYSDVSGTGSQNITVANGTEVSWRVEASGYTTKTGNWTANGKNETESIVLVAYGGEGEDDILSGITLGYGNAFVNSADENRASSSVNFYCESFKKISLKDPTKYNFALYECTDETTQAGGVGTGWITDTRPYVNAWIGVCLKKIDNADFDFSTESNLLSDYITVI